MASKTATSANYPNIELQFSELHQIKDPLCLQRFAPSCALGCFVSSKSRHFDKPSGSIQTLVQHVKIIDIPEDRMSFIQAALVIFKSSQETVSPQIADQIQVSLRYKEEIHKHALHLSTLPNGNPIETALFSGIHGIWHLSHIILIDCEKHQPILAHLDGWMKVNEVYLGIIFGCTLDDAL